MINDLKLKQTIAANIKQHLDKCNDDTVSMADKVIHGKLYDEYGAMLFISHQISKLKKDLK